MGKIIKIIFEYTMGKGRRLDESRGILLSNKRELEMSKYLAYG
jgi:hypothetical protein